jgi:hypothetical protein
MPNSIKHSTTGDTQSLKKGNFFFGVGDIGKGPSSSSGHYNGVTPMSGGYTIYSYNVNETSKISFHSANSDFDLITYTNGVSGQSFTTAVQCLNWYATQTNYACVNKNYEGIITDGLVFNADAGFIPSYPANGTTYYDISQGNNNGNLLNGLSFSTLDGGYFISDGSDDGLESPDNSNLDLNNFTIEGWVWWNQHKNYASLLVKGPGGSGNIFNYSFFFYSSSINLGFGNGSSWQNVGIGLPSLNSWHHIVGTYDGTTLSFYLNGSLANSALTTGTPYVNSDYLQVIQTPYPIDGRVALARVYNRSLSAAEVVRNYNAGLARFNTANIVKNNLVLNLDSTSSVSYPTTGTAWKDLSGYGNNGTLINGPTFDSVSESIIFDGTDDYAVLSNFINKPITEITCESWIKPDKPTISGTIRGGAISSSNSMYLGIIDSVDGGNTFAMHWANQTNNSRVYNWNGSIPNNSWSHLVGTYDGATARAYLNGVEIWSTAQTGVIPDATYYVGTYGGTVVDGTHNFKGNIPIARIYNKALNQNEILQNYYGGSIVTNGLVMALDASNPGSYAGTGTTWKDLTGNGNNVSLVNGPTYMSSGFFRNDTDSYFSGSGTATIPVGNSPYTMIVWARQLSSVGWGFASGFISIGGFFITNGSNSLRTLNGTLGHFHHYWWGNDLSLESNSAGIALDKWFMLSVTFDGTTRRIWVNGISRASDNPAGHNVTSTEIQISKTYGTEYQQGDVAIAQIYNRALSANEMSQNFNAYKSRFDL